MCHMTGESKSYKIVKHEHTGTRFCPIIPIQFGIIHYFVGKIKIWTRNGIKWKMEKENEDKKVSTPV